MQVRQNSRTCTVHVHAHFTQVSYLTAANFIRDICVQSHFVQAGRRSDVHRSHESADCMALLHAYTSIRASGGNFANCNADHDLLNPKLGC